MLGSTIYVLPDPHVTNSVSRLILIQWIFTLPCCMFSVGHVGVYYRVSETIKEWWSKADLCAQFTYSLVDHFFSRVELCWTRQVVPAFISWFPSSPPFRVCRY